MEEAERVFCAESKLDDGAPDGWVIGPLEYACGGRNASLGSSERPSGTRGIQREPTSDVCAAPRRRYVRGKRTQVAADKEVKRRFVYWFVPQTVR